VTAPSERVVLDASAVLALLMGEPGADEVEARLDGSILSAVSLSELFQKTVQHDVDTDGLEYDLEALGVEIRAFDAVQARAAAEIWRQVPRAGLSLGDRACLALASGLGLPAITADRRWLSLELGVEVRVLR
jgi:PIN domain nuclease of toxin-antitoxin system